MHLFPILKFVKVWNYYFVLIVMFSSSMEPSLYSQNILFCFPVASKLFFCLKHIFDYIFDVLLWIFFSAMFFSWPTMFINLGIFLFACIVLK